MDSVLIVVVGKETYTEENITWHCILCYFCIFYCDYGRDQKGDEKLNKLEEGKWQ